MCCGHQVDPPIAFPSGAVAATSARVKHVCARDVCSPFESTYLSRQTAKALPAGSRVCRSLPEGETGGGRAGGPRASRHSRLLAAQFVR